MRNIILGFILLTHTSLLHAQWIDVCSTGNGFVDNFETHNGALYATGFFTSLCGTSCSYVAKFDGLTWQSVSNGFPNAGHHLTSFNNILYGVAYQPAIDSNWVYQYDGTNFIKLGEGTYLSNAVTGFSQTNNLYNVKNYNGKLIACGEFDRVGHKNISGIMQWNGTQWDSLGAGLSSHIDGTAPVMYPHDLCTFGPDLVVSGNFKYAGGQVCNGVARWDGTQWHALGAGFNSTVYSVVVYNGELYAGGDFTASGAQSFHGIAKWNGSAWVDPGFYFYSQNLAAYTFIHTLSVMNNQLWISGGFDRAVVGTDTLVCQNVAFYDGVKLDTVQGGIANNEIEALALYNGLVYAGGGPTNSGAKVATYQQPTRLANLQNEAEIQIYPNPSTGDFLLEAHGEPLDICIVNVFGKTVVNFHTNASLVPMHLYENGMYTVIIQQKNSRIRKLVFVQK